MINEEFYKPSNYQSILARGQRIASGPISVFDDNLFSNRIMRSFEQLPKIRRVSIYLPPHPPFIISSLLLSFLSSLSSSFPVRIRAGRVWKKKTVQAKVARC